MKKLAGILLLFSCTHTFPLTRYTKHSAKKVIVGSRPNKLIKNMSLDEAKQALEYHELAEQPYMSTKVLEHMATIAPSHELKDIRIKLAKSYETTKALELSLKHYEEFIQFYPGSQECEEALYKTIILSFALSYDFSRDQSRTHDTIERAKKFLEKENCYEQFKKEVETVLHDCYLKLYEHCMYVSALYLQQYRNTHDIRDLNAALHRLTICRNNYLEYVPEKKGILFEREQELSSLHPEHTTVLQSYTEPQHDPVSLF